MSKQNRKAIQKEAKEGQSKLTKKEELLRTDILTPKKALSNYPAKIKKVERPLMKSVVKEMQVKKKKQAGNKQSKRSTPGEVSHRESSPQHVHPENERWKQTLDKQNKLHRKILTRQLQKRKGKR